MSLTVTLSDSHNAYLTVSTDDNLLRCQPKNEQQPAAYGINLKQLFVLEFTNDERIIIKSMYGSYISARKHRLCVMTSDTNPKHWERLQLACSGINRIAIRSAFNLYLTCTNNIITQRETIDYFTITFVPVCLRTVQNRLLSAPAEGHVHQVNRKVPSIDEAFRLDFHNGKFYLRTCTNKYVTCLMDGTVSQSALNREYERFTLCKTGEKHFIFRTAHDSVLSAPVDGTDVIQMRTADVNEYFDIIPI